MLSIDTNIVVRSLVDDDAVQTNEARDLIRRHDVFLPLTVVIETEWVLRSLYRFDSQSVNHAIRGFLGLPRVTVQASDTVLSALDWMMQGLDFADALHLAQSRHCNALVTFDKAFVEAATTIDGPRVRFPTDR